jgi:hypothetical protein
LEKAPFSTLSLAQAQRSPPQTRSVIQASDWRRTQPILQWRKKLFQTLQVFVEIQRTIGRDGARAAQISLAGRKNKGRGAKNFSRGMEEDGVTWGESDSIGKQMLRKALNERWQYVGGNRLLRIQVIDGVEHWDYFENGRREETLGVPPE